MPQLMLKENISIKNINTLKEELLDGLDSDDDELLLDFSSVSRVDLSVVQLVMSALKSAKQKKKLIKFKNVSDEIRSQFQLAGLMKKGKE